MSKNTNVADKTFQENVLKVRSSFGILQLESWTVFEIKGPDAAQFLQNRITNDVKALQPGQGQLNASLDRQAKIEGVFSLHCLEQDRFWLSALQDEAQSAIQGIQKYHIVEQFQVQPLESSVWAVQGPQAQEKLSGLLGMEIPAMEPYAHIEVELQGQPVQLIHRSLTGETGFLLVGNESLLKNALNSLAQKEQGVLITPDELDVMRIEAGIPLFGQDYDAETLLPETGLEREAVNYSKGCYLGQETVARIKTYGTVQKALAGLVFEAGVELPPENTPCLLDGKPVGILKSTAFSPTLDLPIGMAYLGKQGRIPGKSLELDIAGQTYKVTVQLLPFCESRDTYKSGEALLQAGLKLFSDGFDEEAIRILQLAIEQEPTLLDAYEALGVILSRQDRFHEAIGLMEKLLLLEPEHVLAHTNLSVFYMKLGDKEKAEDEKAKATMAAFSKKAKESGLVFDMEAEQRKKEQVLLERLSMFQEALKFNPDDALGNFGLGSVCLELKRYTEAIEPFEKMIKVQPKHTVAYLSLGKAYEGVGEPTKAAEIYRKGIEVAAAKGDLMPLNEMQQRLARLNG